MMISPVGLSAKIKAYVDMILEYLYVPKPSHRREPSLSGSWVPPPVGYLMVNVDAAIFASSRQMGAGIVIRDHAGNCIASCRSLLPAITIPELAEAHAIRIDLSFAREEGLDNLVLASDCLSVVQRITGKVKDRSFCGAVIQDIRELISSFSACSLLHVRREQNVAAHFLARSSESQGCRVWRGVPPDCIRETICRDIIPQ